MFSLAVTILGACLVLPAAASAHPLATDVTVNGSTAYHLLKNTCTSSGGRRGFGKAVIQVEQHESGKSGVAQFRQRVWYQTKDGRRWKSFNSSGWKYSSYFGNTSSSTDFSHKWVYNWGTAHPYFLSRIKWRGEWLSASGRVLYSQVITGKTC